jgi:hypothetical protein
MFLNYDARKHKIKMMGWNLGAPPVCRCWVRCNQSCGHSAICSHSTTVLLVLLREEPALVQQRRFFVNNGRLCDAMYVTACICFGCVPAEATLRLGCWQHLFPWVSHNVFLHLPNVQQTEHFVVFCCLFFCIVVMAPRHRSCVPFGSVQRCFTNHTKEVAMNGSKKLERWI